MRTFAVQFLNCSSLDRDSHLQMAETIMGIRGWGEKKTVVVGLKGCYPYTTFYSMGLWGPLHIVAIWTFTFHEKSG